MIRIIEVKTATEKLIFVNYNLHIKYGQAL